MPELLPMADAPHPERADAARNRERALATAARLLETVGPDCLTMDAIAAAAGIGKGTLFRRFQSREGLMGALLNRSEMQWQQAVLSGPPPLGPGADPWQRLLAFGRSRLETTLLHADLIRNAGRSGTRSFAAYSFAMTHVRHLLGELDVEGDLPLLAVALMAPLELPILEQQVGVEGLDVERVRAGWVDLARRIAGR